MGHAQNAVSSKLQQQRHYGSVVMELGTIGFEGAQRVLGVTGLPQLMRKKAHCGRTRIMV
jgi:hypothetical protein